LDSSELTVSELWRERPLKYFGSTTTGRAPLRELH
jgi:hypothetical protein